MAKATGDLYDGNVKGIWYCIDVETQNSSGVWWPRQKSHILMMNHYLSTGDLSSDLIWQMDVLVKVVV